MTFGELSNGDIFYYNQSGSVYVKLSNATFNNCVVLTTPTNNADLWVAKGDKTFMESRTVVTKVDAEFYIEVKERRKIECH